MPQQSQYQLVTINVKTQCVVKQVLRQHVKVHTLTRRHIFIRSL